MKHLLYARYLFWHKYWVFIEGVKRGLFLRVIIHDYDKFFPSRWMAYANWFEGKEKTPEVKRAFMDSWRGHANRNDHHWQHWVAISDKGQVTPHEMSDKARREMLADWISANRVIQGTLKPGHGVDLKGWFKGRSSTILLAPKTLRWVEDELEKL